MDSNASRPTTCGPGENLPSISRSCPCDTYTLRWLSRVAHWVQENLAHAARGFGAHRVKGLDSVASAEAHRATHAASVRQLGKVLMLC